MRTFLHIGCGQQNKNNLRGSSSEGWQEIRFDIDPKVKPDIIWTFTDMPGLESLSVDAVHSSQNIEYLFPYEVPMALEEFRRVLKPNGMVAITCPDLISECKVVVEDKFLENICHDCFFHKPPLC